MSVTRNKTDANQAELEQLRDTVRSLTAEISALTARNTALQNQLDHMTELLANAQRELFGQRSEKRMYVLPDGEEEGEQLSFFNEAEAVQDPKQAEPEEKTLVAAYERKKKRTIDEQTAELPVKKVILDLPEEERVCSVCGSPLTFIGEKLLRRELEIIPRTVQVVEYYTRAYACKPCEKSTGYANIYSPNAPPSLLKHSLASPSAVADVMTKKYVDGLPLARQEKIWIRDGIDISRATMANWVIQCTQKWLKPLYGHMRRQLLTENVIHADETVVQVHREEGKSNTSESRMWVYASGKYSEKPVRYFEYQPDRSGKHPAKLLKGFSGCLVTDGYAAYDQVTGASRCGCWAHMRRKWREAMPKGATTANSKAAVGYSLCSRIFALERELAQEEGEPFDPSRRLAARKNKIAPVLDKYWAFVDSLTPAGGSKLEEAVTYAQNQRDDLNAFMSHGEVEISNNLAENAIRPFVVGRKAWLFCDTPKGADSSAIVYTLVETAKANGIEPHRYLEYVLDRMRYLRSSPSAADLEKLMPWSTALKEQPGV